MSNLNTSLPVLHTSDRALYKRCRRKWWLASELGQSLIVSDEPHNKNLWIGTGFHFMLQDYHSWRVFDEPFDAWKAYVATFDRESLPLEYGPDIDRLVAGMFHYYTNYWLPIHGGYSTLWINGIPQVEVSFELPIPDVNAIYAGTFDRVVMDAEKRIWIVEYKTAASIDSLKLETDTQVSAYTWAARQVYGKAFEGILYYQFKKALAEYPNENKNGEFSKDKRQNTTAMLYRKALMDKWGEIPVDYYDIIQYFADQETIGEGETEGDAFIRRNRVRRNEFTVASELYSIQAEAREMINPELSIYKNATRDCAWDCQFREVCIAMDDGSDWHELISLLYRTQTREERESWRDQVVYPNNDRLQAMLTAQPRRVTAPLLLG